MKGITTLLLLGTMMMSAEFGFTQTWTQVNVANTNWYSLAASSDGSILYASAGTTNGQIIYASTNSGLTWNPTTLPFTNLDFQLAVSADGTKIFAGGALPGNTPIGSTNSNPLFLSTNSGLTWNSIFSAETNSISSVSMSADGNTLMAGQYSRPCMIFISTNSGASWSTNPVSYLPQTLVTANGKKMMAMVSSYILITTNAGVTWITNNLPGSGYSWNTIAASPDGNILAAVGHIFLGGTAICVSTNSGTTWANNVASFSTYYASGAFAMSADGSKMMAASLGALFISTNRGMTWAQAAVPSTNWSSVAFSADGSKWTAAAQGVTAYTKATGGIWIAQTTPSPQLNLTPAFTNLTFSWIMPSTNLMLQQSSDLTSWVNVTNLPVLNLTNLHNQISLPPIGNSGFFRLKTP